MKFEVSNNLIPVIYVGSYGEPVYEEFVCDGEDIKNSILENAPEFLEERIREVCPSAQFSDYSVYMPRAYNFETDTLNFTLDISDADYQRMYDECINDPEFEEFLKDNYSSYDGFFSYMANNLEDFETQKDFYKVSAMLNFLTRDEDYREGVDYDYDEALNEWMWNNCPRYYDELDNGCAIGYDYQDDGSGKYRDGFYAEIDGEQVAFFPVEGSGNKANWNAYNKAYDYIEENNN